MTYQRFKRICDVLIATSVLILVSPILVLIGLILLVTGEGEVFYYQNRIGLGGEEFPMIKFATMLKDSPNIGTGSITTRNDPRVTFVGRFLRITKLNELPQLINVVKGEMSFVGPRPLLRDTFKLYGSDIQKQISSVVPGITGIGSVVFRDEEILVSAPGIDPVSFYKNNIAPYKALLELWYLEHRSFRTDFALLCTTALVIAVPISDVVFKIFPTLPKKPEILVN